MSYKMRDQLLHAATIWQDRRTNDLRYDSKDSREIEKGSFSLSMLRWLEDMVDVGDLAQKLFFSVGEGCSRYQHSQALFPACAWAQLTGR